MTNIAFCQPDTVWTRAADNFGDDLQVIRTTDGGFAIGGSGWAGEEERRYSDFHLAKTDSFGRIEWETFYAGTPDDRHVIDKAKSLYQMPDDGYVLAGITGPEGMVVRTDSEGEMIWRRYYLREDGLTNFWECAPFDDGGILVVGWAMIVKLDEENGDVEWSRTIDGARFWCLNKTDDGGFILGGAHSADILALKLDSDGETEWAQTYGTEDAETSSGVIQTSDGGYCFAGSLNFGGGGDYYAMIVRTDSHGELIWQEIYDNWRGDHLRGVVETPDGGFAAVGFNGTNEYYLMRVDYEGDVLWRAYYDLSAYDKGCSIHLMEDNSYLFGGFSNRIGCLLVRTEPDPVDIPFELETEADYYDFGELEVDSTSVWEFEIYNTGRRYAVLDTLWFEGSNTEAFSCPLELPFRINPEDTCLVPVLFQPSADTAYSATLVLPYGDDQTLEVALFGNGYINSAPEEPNVMYEFALYEAYPNPFNSTTTITYGLDKSAPTRIAIYDLTGREIVTLINDKLEAGYYNVVWDAAAFPSGLYICRLNAGGFSQSRKLVLVR